MYHYTVNTAGVKMVCKRPFHDEESYEIAPKHRRQQDHTAQLSPIPETDPCNDGSRRLASGDY
ncbi:hypothetical protein LguiB_019634 [Lonicera macranthoides]